MTGTSETQTADAAAEQPRWEPLSVEHVRELFSDAGVPWWIAGGVALDLFLGRTTRAHEDIDVAVFRDDADAIRHVLRGWEIAVNDGAAVATLWRERDPLSSSAHSVRARERGHDAWQLEVLFETRKSDRWSYRRDPSIGVHASDIGRRTGDGVPYLRPEIVLLYKSKDPRAVDETDFLTVLPHLDAAQRAFLAAGLWTTAPGHRWLTRFDRAK